MPDQEDKQAEAHQREIKERAAREMQRIPAIQSWPVDAEGNPMAIVMGACSDLVPTVQFGNTVVGPVTIMRPIANGDLQSIGDAARETQRMAEFVVGVERRLLQWAIDPASKITNPQSGEVFAAPPAGYDPTKLEAHPGDAPVVPPPPTPQAAPAAEVPDPLPESLTQPPTEGDTGVSVG